VADWDSRFMGLALHVAEWSKDRSRKVGCVIVGPSNEIRAVGYNGFPRNINDDSCAPREAGQSIRGRSMRNETPFTTPRASDRAGGAVACMCHGFPAWTAPGQSSSRTERTDRP